MVAMIQMWVPFELCDSQIGPEASVATAISPHTSPFEVLLPLSSRLELEAVALVDEDDSLLR